MRTIDEVIAQGVPPTLWRFVSEGCRLRADALTLVAAEDVPEPAKRLLVHRRDMTSTLAEFHGSALRVDIFQQLRIDGLYLREVFLRTFDGDRMVEYGVIAIALEQFQPEAQQAITAGEAPLGELLHRFKIPFTSAPICFFSVPAEGLGGTPVGVPDGAICHGRFNRLTKATGQPLAWIMEILPPAI